jgi:hypothetical protein
VLIWSRGTGAGGRAEELAPVQMETALRIAAVGKGARTRRTLDFENRHRPIRRSRESGRAHVMSYCDAYVTRSVDAPKRRS